MTECTRQAVFFSSLGRQRIVADFSGGRVSFGYAGKAVGSRRISAHFSKSVNTLDGPRCRHAESKPHRA